MVAAADKFVSHFAYLNDGANISNSCDKEGDGLQEEVYEVVILPVDEIVAAA